MRIFVIYCGFLSAWQEMWPEEIFGDCLLSNKQISSGLKNGWMPFSRYDDWSKNPRLSVAHLGRSLL